MQDLEHIRPCLEQLNIYLPKVLSNIVCGYIDYDGVMSFEIDFVPHKSLTDSKELKVKNWLENTHQKNLKKSIYDYLNRFFYTSNKRDFNFNICKIKNFSFKIVLFFQTKKESENLNEVVKELTHFYSNLHSKIYFLWSELAEETFSTECKFRIKECYIKQCYTKQLQIARKSRLDKQVENINFD